MSLFSASFFSTTFGGFGSSFFSSAAKAGAIRKAHRGRNANRSKRFMLHPPHSSQREARFLHLVVYLSPSLCTNGKCNRSAAAPPDRPTLALADKDSHVPSRMSALSVDRLLVPSDGTGRRGGRPSPRSPGRVEAGGRL